MKKIILPALTCLFIACNAPERITITNVHDLAAHRPNSYIYSIPRTRLALKISAVRHFTVPGPYSDYAERYLGIEGAPTISKTEWEISDIKLITIIEPDPEYYFSLQTSNSAILMDQLLKFTSEGLILCPDEFYPFMDFSPHFEDIPEHLHFTDLTVKNLYSEDASKRASKTSVPVDLPVIKQKEAVKSVNEKARDAADFIIKIRKRRFKLLAGQYDVYPEGTALETSIRELNELEKEYLSLFIGKVYTDTIANTYFYIPQAGQNLERNVFCRFSDETGFYDATSASGRPLVLELKSLQFTEGLKQLQLPHNGSSYENMLLYRIPDKASVRIFYGSSVLLDAEVKIYQYGSFVPYHFPVK